MARKLHPTVTPDLWTRDLLLADEAIGAYKNMTVEQKERILTTIRSLQQAGEQFYQTWQALLASLDDGSDGLQIPDFARKVLKMNALRVWMEPNPVVREKIWDALGSASVPKPQSVPSKRRGLEAATLAGKAVARPDW